MADFQLKYKNQFLSDLKNDGHFDFEFSHSGTDVCKKYLVTVQLAKNVCVWSKSD